MDHPSQVLSSAAPIGPPSLPFHDDATLPTSNITQSTADDSSLSTTGSVDPTSFLDLDSEEPHGATSLSYSTLQAPQFITTSNSFDPSALPTRSLSELAVSSLAQRRQDCAHLDSGSQASTTHLLHLLFAYQPYSPTDPPPIRMQAADAATDHVPIGYGYLRIPADTPAGYVSHKTFYTPSLPATIVSPASFSHDDPDAWHGYTLDVSPPTSSFRCILRYTIPRPSITISGSLFGQLCYTSPLYVPGSPGHPDLPLVQSPNPSLAVRQLSSAATRLLWHQRLAHCSDDKLVNAHRYATGVPQFKYQTSILEQCPVCLAAKMRHRDRGSSPTRSATKMYQGLSMDFAFVGQRSQDLSRQQDYLGYNGETCFILIYDHKTETLFGSPRMSKATPLQWLRRWLHQHVPKDLTDRYVFLDQGGELFANPALRLLLERDFQYRLCPTGTAAHHQNGLVERANQTVCHGIKQLLLGAALPILFWPCAFHYFLRVKNAALPRRGAAQSSHEAATGSKDDLSNLRTFGCRVWIKATDAKSGQKLLTYTRKGRFLGFRPGTDKNIIWVDDATGNVKYGYHSRFDEGMNDLSFAELPPNVQHLSRYNSDTPPTPESLDTTVPVFAISEHPFFTEHDYTVKVHPKCTHDTFGFELESCPELGRAYIVNTTKRKNSSVHSLASTAKAARNKCKGRYITAIADSPVFTLDSAVALFHSLRQSQATSFSITLADEQYQRKAVRDRREQELAPAMEDPILSFNPDLEADSVSVHSLAAYAADPYDELLGNQDPVDSILLDPDVIAAVTALLHPPLPDHIDTSIASVCALSSEAITPAEQALPRFTRRLLKGLPTWDKWHAAEVKQLDQFHALGMFGDPITPPPDAILLRPQWAGRVKLDGTRRLRLCADGSPRAAPALHANVETFASCLEHPVLRLFFALAAADNLIVFGGDARDAFAHSPGPTVPTFLRLDEAFIEWYHTRFGVRLPRHQVLPIKRALQGHPEAARLWELHINAVLTKIGFQSTTHERNIYSLIYESNKVLLVRQVDDFALACLNAAIAEALYALIGQHLQVAGESDVPFASQGVLKDFNGYDVLQTRHYIKIHAQSYIRRLLKAHHWETPSKDEAKPDSLPPAPINPDDVKALYLDAPGPAEGTPDHSSLTEEFGFKYRTLLGELLFAYVICRLDIGYAVTTLAKFSVAPHRLHFQSLKAIAKYLRHTIDWGIVYWRTSPNMALPLIPFDQLEFDPTLPAIPWAISPHQGHWFTDAAHGNDPRQRRSTTGVAGTVAGACIAYRSKTQPIAAQSSTEAELVACNAGAKMAKYIRFVLNDRRKLPTTVVPRTVVATLRSVTLVYSTGVLLVTSPSSTSLASSTLPMHSPRPLPALLTIAWFDTSWVTLVPLPTGNPPLDPLPSSFQTVSLFLMILT